MIDGHPDLERYRADVRGLVAHLLELQGDVDNAATAFERSYAHADERGNHTRAATSASDLGRLAGYRGNAGEGLRWLALAERHLQEAPNALAMRTVQVRKAHLIGMLGTHQEAIRILDAVLEDVDDRTAPDAVVDALLERGCQHALLGNDAAAAKDLSAAITVTHTRKMHRHEAYARRELAHLQLRGGDSQSAAAVEEFRAAIVLASRVDPPQPRLLLDLAADVLETPTLIRRGGLDDERRDQLKAAIDVLGVASRPAEYQQTLRPRRMLAASSALSLVLRGLAGDVLELASTTIDIATRVVVRRGIGGQGNVVGSVHPAEYEVLDVLSASETGMQLWELLAALGLESEEALQKRLGRLRALLGDDLVVDRDGKRRRYRLKWLADRRDVTKTRSSEPK